MRVLIIRVSLFRHSPYNDLFWDGDLALPKAISLTDHVPLITAWSNDTAYEHIFAEQLENLVEPGDVVIAISASGNSLNLINALRLAERSRAFTIGLLGAEGARSRTWWTHICSLLARISSRKRMPI